MLEVDIKIAEDKCIGCDECYLACHAEVFEMIDSVAYIVNLKDCLICDSCEIICPTGAITVRKSED